MKQSLLSAYISFSITVLALFLEFWLTNLQPLYFLLLLTGVLGWIGIRYKIQWLRTLLFFLLSLASAIGILFGGSPIFALVVVIAGFNAWEFANLSDYLALTGKGDEAVRLFRHQLLYIVVINGLGFLLSISALLIKAQFNFIIAILLGIIAILGLSQLVAFLTRESN